MSEMETRDTSVPPDEEAAFEQQEEAASAVGDGGDGRKVEEKEGAAQESAEETEREETLDEALKAARAEAKENYDRFLRAAAELDNFRKRAARMRVEAREECLRGVLLQIAPVLDNMRRALAQDSENVESLKQGVELIYGQFKDILQGYGLEEIESIGQPFDPNVHEAMMEVENDEHPPGTVVEEMEKGYKLSEKVVRPARVIVSKAGGDHGQGNRD